MQAANLGVGVVGGTAAVRHAVDPAPTGGDVWRVFAQVPDLVNGNAANFGFIYVSAGLAAEYHWVSDAVFGNDSVADTEAHMRDLVLNEAVIIALRLVDGGMAELKARVIALIVAVARRTIRRAWGVANADIVPSQLYTPVNAAGAAVTVDYAGDFTDDVEGVGEVADLAAERVEMDALWTGDVEVFLGKVARCAIAMPTANGVNLVETQVHHYVGEFQIACDCIIGQHMTVTPNVPAGIVVDDLKDALCHKAAHPIKSPILAGLARSEEVRNRLARLGEGAACVRLPAKYAPEKAASAIVALVHRTAQAGVSSNVAVSTASADALATLITTTINDTPGQAGILAATAHLDAFKLRNGLHVAWCAGFYAALCDESNAPRRARSVLVAKSVATLVAEFQVGYAEGHGHYGNAVRYRRAQAREGFLVGYGIMGAAKPADWAPPADPAPRANP